KIARAIAPRFGLGAAGAELQLSRMRAERDLEQALESQRGVDRERCVAVHVGRAARARLARLSRGRRRETRAAQYKEPERHGAREPRAAAPRPTRVGLAASRHAGKSARNSAQMMEVRM